MVLMVIIVPMVLMVLMVLMVIVLVLVLWSRRRGSNKSCPMSGKVPAVDPSGQVPHILIASCPIVDADPEEATILLTEPRGPGIHR